LREFRIYTRTAQVRPHYDGANPALFVEYDHVLYDNIHSEGSSLLFCDTHAKWRKKVSVKFTDFGADPNYSVACKTAALDETGSKNGLRCPPAF